MHQKLDTGNDLSMPTPSRQLTVLLSAEVFSMSSVSQQGAPKMYATKLTTRSCSICSVWSEVASLTMNSFQFYC